jgi:hypothetical protein
MQAERYEVMVDDAVADEVERLLAGRSEGTPPRTAGEREQR